MSAKRNPLYNAAVQMYERGLSITEVAYSYGVTRQSMWKILRRRGCKFRTRDNHGEENRFYRGTKADGYAHNAVEYAVRKGILVRPDSCQECGLGGTFKDGRTNIQAHHPDYNKPLEVQWLCQPCHHNWHKKNKSVPVQTESGGSNP